MVMQACNYTKAVNTTCFVLLFFVVTVSHHVALEGLELTM